MVPLNEVLIAKIVLGYLSSRELSGTVDCFVKECEGLHSSETTGLCEKERILNHLEGQNLLPSLEDILNDYFAYKGPEDHASDKVYMLWKQLDVVIGQLRAITLGKTKSKAFMNSRRAPKTFNKLVDKAEQRSHSNASQFVASMNNIFSESHETIKDTHIEKIDDLTLVTSGTSGTGLKISPVRTKLIDNDKKEFRSPRSRKTRHPKRNTNGDNCRLNEEKASTVPEVPSTTNDVPLNKEFSDLVAALISNDKLSTKLADNINKVVSVEPKPPCKENDDIVDEIIKLTADDPDLNILFSMLGGQHHDVPHQHDILHHNHHYNLNAAVESNNTIESNTAIIHNTLGIPPSIAHSNCIKLQPVVSVSDDHHHRIEVVDSNLQTTFPILPTAPVTSVVNRQTDTNLQQLLMPTSTYPNFFELINSDYPCMSDLNAFSTSLPVHSGVIPYNHVTPPTSYVTSSLSTSYVTSSLQSSCVTSPPPSSQVTSLLSSHTSTSLPVSHIIPPPQSNVITPPQSHVINEKEMLNTPVIKNDKLFSNSENEKVHEVSCNHLNEKDVLMKHLSTSDSNNKVDKSKHSNVLITPEIEEQHTSILDQCENIDELEKTVAWGDEAQEEVDDNEILASHALLQLSTSPMKISKSSSIGNVISKSPVSPLALTSNRKTSREPICSTNHTVSVKPASETDMINDFTCSHDDQMTSQNIAMETCDKSNDNVVAIETSSQSNDSVLLQHSSSNSNRKKQSQKKRHSKGANREDVNKETSSSSSSLEPDKKQKRSKETNFLAKRLDFNAATNSSKHTKPSYQGIVTPLNCPPLPSMINIYPKISITSKCDPHSPAAMLHSKLNTFTSKKGDIPNSKARMKKSSVKRHKKDETKVASSSEKQSNIDEFHKFRIKGNAISKVLIEQGIEKSSELSNQGCSPSKTLSMVINNTDSLSKMSDDSINKVAATCSVDRICTSSIDTSLSSLTDGIEDLGVKIISHSRLEIREYDSPNKTNDLETNESYESFSQADKMSQLEKKAERQKLVRAKSVKSKKLKSTKALQSKTMKVKFNFEKSPFKSKRKSGLNVGVSAVYMKKENILDKDMDDALCNDDVMTDRKLRPCENDLEDNNEIITNTQQKYPEHKHSKIDNDTPSVSLNTEENSLPLGCVDNSLVHSSPKRTNNPPVPSTFTTTSHDIITTSTSMLNTSNHSFDTHSSSNIRKQEFSHENYNGMKVSDTSSIKTSDTCTLSPSSNTDKIDKENMKVLNGENAHSPTSDLPITDPNPSPGCRQVSTSNSSTPQGLSDTSRNDVGGEVVVSKTKRKSNKRKRKLSLLMLNVDNVAQLLSGIDYS